MFRSLLVNAFTKASWYGCGLITQFVVVGNDWFSSCLTLRAQTTQIRSSICSREKMSFGAPEGSVFGPYFS